MGIIAMGIIGSHVAKLNLYTSLSLACISNRNQRCLGKNFLHNGFSDYFLFCTKRGAFVHEQRSDRSKIMRTFNKIICFVCHRLHLMKMGRSAWPKTGKSWKG